MTISHLQFGSTSAVRHVAAALVMGIVAVAIADPTVSRLRLRANVVVSADTVTLGDVLALAGAEAELAEKIADKPVFTDGRGAGCATISHDDVARRLTELDVHPGRVLLEGAHTCRVVFDRPSAAPESPRRPVEVGVAAMAPGPARVGVGATLADRIREIINRDLAALGGTSEVEFERAGREFLDLTAPFEFDIRAADREKLGVREFRVTVKRDGKVVRTATVAARVRLVRNAVVAARPLSIGNLIRDGDVGLEPQVFDSVATLGLDSVEQALGRQVTRFVPVGEMLQASGLKAVDLVQRSRPVTVLSGDGGVQMRLAGIALDAGAYGDSIRVRLGEGRGARQQVRGVVVGVNTVRLDEVQP